MKPGISIIPLNLPLRRETSQLQSIIPVCLPAPDDRQHGAALHRPAGESVARPFERNAAGSISYCAPRASTVKSASPPTFRPPPRPNIRRGLSDISATSFSSVSVPGNTIYLYISGKAHSKPTIPMALPASPRDFSSAVWGAWSVAITSIVPSATPAISAARSSRLRSGGFILKRPSSCKSSSQSSR